MSIQIPYLSATSPFPAVERALKSPNGLLAYGADLSPSRLFNAYYEGIFPWFSEGEPILWWSPSPRALLFLDNFHVSSSMFKWLRKSSYKLSLNQAFGDVVRHCATVPRYHPQPSANGTWITDEMISAYQQLHHVGLAHSVEVWRDDTLVGGLYGVAVGKVFCGESMFHKEANTSKLAMFALVQHMKRCQQAFIDCQMPTPHLSSLGSTSVTRDEYLSLLRTSRDTFDKKGGLVPHYLSTWSPQELFL